MSWQEELNEKRRSSGWYGCIAPDGWKNIILDLDRQLAYLDPNYEFQQVKEKFGTLRFYYGTIVEDKTVQEIMDTLVRHAEMMSAKVCEVCGNSSWIQRAHWGNKFDDTAVLKETVRGGWLKTICDSCDTDGLYRKIDSEDED